MSPTLANVSLRRSEPAAKRPPARVPAHSQLGRTAAYASAIVYLAVIWAVVALGLFAAGTAAVFRGWVWPGLGVLLSGVAVGWVGLQVTVDAYRMPSEAMKPTLKIGDRFFALTLGYEPSVGDVVVFHPPAGADSDTCAEPRPEAMCATPTPGLSSFKFVKRIVAGPGDRVAMPDGRLFVNGKPENRTELRPCASREDDCHFPKELVIPEDHWFVLGDNRGASDDSRFWGPVPARGIIGRLWFRYVK
jgi:signal peptidase I